MQEAEAIANIEAEMRSVLAAERARAAVDVADLLRPLYGMMEYHLGWVDTAFNPDLADGGKKLRGQLCLLACALFDSAPDKALPFAATVELLHNFTLIHDDIQDRSLVRRHRPTVWSQWGIAQAINAGDGLYALARLALLRLVERGVDPALVLELALAGERTLLQIMHGQYLDLSFETDWEATEPRYLHMIEGKTASLLGYCLAGGGRIGGADEAEAATLKSCGLALGLGFQVRDDILGIWGEPSVTGKPPAADIRARKKTLPILIALERAQPAEIARLQAAFAQPEPDDSAVAEVLTILDRTAAAAHSQRWVETYHQRALTELAALGRTNAAGLALRRLAERLVERDF